MTYKFNERENGNSFAKRGVAAKGNRLPLTLVEKIGKKTLHTIKLEYEI